MCLNILGRLYMHIYTGNNKILFYCNDNAEDHINCKTEESQTTYAYYNSCFWVPCEWPTIGLKAHDRPLS